MKQLSRNYVQIKLYVQNINFLFQVTGIVSSVFLVLELIFGIYVAYSTPKCKTNDFLIYTGKCSSPQIYYGVCNSTSTTIYRNCCKESCPSLLYVDNCGSGNDNGEFVKLFNDDDGFTNGFYIKNWPLICTATEAFGALILMHLGFDIIFFMLSMSFWFKHLQCLKLNQSYSYPLIISSDDSGGILSYIQSIFHFIGYQAYVVCYLPYITWHLLRRLFDVSWMENSKDFEFYYMYIGNNSYESFSNILGAYEKGTNVTDLTNLQPMSQKIENSSSIENESFSDVAINVNPLNSGSVSDETKGNDCSKGGNRYISKTIYDWFQMFQIMNLVCENILEIFIVFVLYYSDFSSAITIVYSVPAIFNTVLRLAAIVWEIWRIINSFVSSIYISLANICCSRSTSN